VSISSEVSLLSIAIALHTCYILVSIALSLLFLGNTILRSGVLRCSWTMLSLLAKKRPLAFRFAALGNKCHTIREELFLTLIVHFEVL